jgi:hypothetical protein
VSSADFASCAEQYKWKHTMLQNSTNKCPLHTAQKKCKIASPDKEMLKNKIEYITPDFP